MTRFLAISLATLLLGGSASPAEAGDAKGPACANVRILEGQSFYTVDSSVNAVLQLQVETGRTPEPSAPEPLCSGATLTVYLTAGVTTVAVIYPGANFTSCGLACYTLTYNYGPASDAPSSVSFYAQTTIGRSHVVDRAPNVGVGVRSLCDSGATAANPDGYTTDPNIPDCTPPGGYYLE